MTNPSKDGPASSIFVVEDEAIVARDLITQLHDLGYLVAGHATTGEEAVAKLRALKVDLVMMDISLGGSLDGINTARILRDELSIPCIFLTAYSSPEILARAKLVEPLAYVLKPFTERDVQTVLEMATYRAATETRLRALGAAFTAVSEGLTIAGPDRRISSVNPAFCAMFGYSQEEVLGRDYGMLQGPGTSPETRESIRQALHQGRSFSGEILNYRKDGTAFWNQLTISPVVNASGAATHYIGIARDISERKRVEERNLHAQRMEAIGSLAGGIAHDLNNILAPIMAMPFLLRGQLKPGVGERYVDIIASCAQRGSETLKQLLIFGRGLESRRTLVRVQLLCREIVQLMQETFPRQIQITLESEATLPSIFADATQLHLVLLNLCINARDAMPEGGSLVLRAKVASLQENNPALPAGYPAGDYVLIEVSDTGPGIKPEIRDRIFEPFFTTKAVGKGTGLGLSTVRGIVRSHFGFLQLQSEVDVGTTFQVYLPPDKGRVTLLSESIGAELEGGQGELILVVDDESYVAETLRAVLDVAGYQVLVAGSGRDALVKFGEHGSKIRLVITDMMMPDLSGPALVRAIRQISDGIPVVALSGLAEDEVDWGGEIAQPARRLEKPVKAEDLLRVVNGIIHSHPAGKDQ